MNDFWECKYVITGKKPTYYTVRGDDVNEATRAAERLCPKGYILATVLPTHQRKYEPQVLNDDDVECPDCDGSGLFNPHCEECDGQGWVDDPSDGGTMSCPMCDNEACPTCGGTGERD